MVDVGANVDCSPHMLAQFAIMGEMYSRVILRRENPRVGLLSIGEEEHKGNEMTRAATPLLGVKGVCIICHGRSNANAIKNAIRVAAEFSGGKINQRIESEFKRWTAANLVT